MQTFVLDEYLNSKFIQNCISLIPIHIYLSTTAGGNVGSNPGPTIAPGKAAKCC